MRRACPGRKGVYLSFTLKPDLPFRPTRRLSFPHDPYSSTFLFISTPFFPPYLRCISAPIFLHPGPRGRLRRPRHLSVRFAQIDPKPHRRGVEKEAHLRDMLGQGLGPKRPGYGYGAGSSLKVVL